MGQLRMRIFACIGGYLGLDLSTLDAHRRIYDVFLESLQDGPDSENMPSATDGLRPTDYITLGVSMALEEEFTLSLDGDWWSGVLQFGSFFDLENRLRQEMEDRVCLATRRQNEGVYSPVLDDVS